MRPQRRGNPLHLGQSLLEDRLHDRGLDLSGLEVVSELLERGLLLAEVNLLPKVWEVVVVLDGRERGLDEVTTGGGSTAGLCEAILHTSVLEHLVGHSVVLGHLGTPVTTHDGHDVDLGVDDGTADGGGNLLGGLDAEADVAVEVADNDEGLEAVAGTSSGLLLHRHDLHDLILESGEEEVDDLVLLDGHREVVDVVDETDLAVLHEAAELGARDPLLLILASLSLSLSLALALALALAEAALTAKSSLASFGRSLG